MPHLVITQEYSHMGGEEILAFKYPKLKAEIIQILTTTNIPPASKISREKTKRGQLVWSGKDFNKPLRKAFRLAGWKKKRANLKYGRYIECDYCKRRVAIEVQFGKYSFVDTDFSKFEILHFKNKIDLCIEIVPTSQLLKTMCTGPADFIQVISRIQGKGRNTPAVPIWIIGVNVTQAPSRTP